MNVPILHVCIILAAVALWSINNYYNELVVKLKVEKEKLRLEGEKLDRELKLKKELDEVANEHNELCDTFKMYHDLGDVRKCKDLQHQCVELNQKYLKIKDRI